MAMSRAIGVAIAWPLPPFLGLGVRASAGGRSPAEEFAPLAAVFRRRLLSGAGAASLVAVGANFGGFTSFLLGFSPEAARELRLDVLYPVEGFTRCYDPDQGFEFIFPADWVGDPTWLSRAVDIAESQRSLEPPPLGGGRPTSRISRGPNEPAVAFAPPGSSGEFNVSVIVSPVPPDFSIEAFGRPKEVGESVLRKIAASRRGADVRASLLDATLRQDPSMKVSYYKLEFSVESPSFRRHNVAVCTARSGKLFTLNAQECLQSKIKEGMWYLGSGCSRHMTEERAKFKILQDHDGGYIVYGDNAKGKIIGIGSVGNNSITLNNIFLVDGLNHNLISISQL